MKITSKLFGKTKNGENVQEYTLINDNNCFISILTYGGIITNITVPDKNGKLANVVLGFNNITDYEEHSPFFGAITGRFAGRIANASFTIGETTYELPKNDETNCLHGGIKGFDKVIWSPTEVITEDSVRLSLNYLSKDLEEGFPGNLDMCVTYTWTNENELVITYHGTTDKETPVTVTNHSYFNLSGNLTSPILDHDLYINASNYVELGDLSIPNNIAPVNNTPFDFTVAKKVGRDIKEENEQLINAGGYDHPFVLDKTSGSDAIFSHIESGRKLEVATDEEALVCYSGNYLSDEATIFNNISNEPLVNRCGLCLETQYYPNNMNFDMVPTKTLKPGETYHSSTSFKFGIL